MRSIGLLLAAGVFAAFAWAAPAAAVEVRTGIGQGGGSADITARGGTPSKGGGHRQGSSSGSVSACSSQVIDWTGNGALALVPCNYHEGMAGPFAPVEPAQAAPSAAEIAAIADEFARNLPMPVPQPSLSTSTGITGALHSLDLSVPTRSYFASSPTPFGPMSAVAHGEFLVDWGDGSSETYSVSGGAWPNKDISHSWDRAGSYDIYVQGRWNVDWQLGSLSGVVGGLQTEGRINGFEVAQAQALLQRN